MSPLTELQALIQEKHNLDPATLDVNLSMREQGLDSLAVAEFLFEVEDRLGINLPDLPDGVDTLAALAGLVEQVRAQQIA
jgi:acyl carrier protein